MTEIQQWIVQTICIKNWLLVNVCYIITLGNQTVGIQFSKIKNKNYPLFLDFENLRFPLKKYPFLAKWVRAWMYALVETDGTGQTWGVPSGVLPPHCNDLIMGSMASQLTSLTIVYSTVYSAANQRKHQSSASLAFVRWIHRGPVNSPHKWPVTRKLFPFDDVIMKFEPNPISLYRNAWELLDQWWDGESWDSNAWEFSGALPKVNQASRVPHQSWPQFD